VGVGRCGTSVPHGTTPHHPSPTRGEGVRALAFVNLAPVGGEGGSCRRKDHVGATLVVALFPADAMEGLTNPVRGAVRNRGDHKGRPYSGKGRRLCPPSSRTFQRWLIAATSFRPCYGSHLEERS